MKVQDLMSHSVSCVRPDASVQQIAKQLMTEDVGSIPVCDDNSSVLGIVTDRDIVLRYTAKDDPSLKAQDIMSPNPVSVSPKTSVHQAAELMARHKVRRLPVVENQRLVGYLSIADLARKNIYLDEAADALSLISKVNLPLQ